MSIASTGIGKNERQPLTCRCYHIEQVAELLGVGRNSAYEGARRGDFPTIRIGKRLLAPKVAIDKMLGIGSEGAA
jgi:hypothetical protein